jgi:YidC/Oxa1 family membrane protein insertase
VETVEAVADERERRVEVLGPRFTIAFTNKGARLISWRLQRHRDERGDGMEMVPPHGPGPRPLDIETGEAGLDERLREALFVPSVETLRIDERGEGTLGFTFAAGEIEAEKSLVFTADGLVRVSVSVRREGRDVARWLVWGPGVGHPSEAEREVQGYQAPQGVALLSTGKVERRAAAKLPAGGETLPAARWAGVESQYFAAILIPAQGSGPAQLRAVPVAGAKDGPPETAALAAVAVSEAPALVFVGAKDHDRLSRLGHELQRVVPVGDWIGPIVVPLMRLLRGVHARIGNYGWAIVLITILINVVMAPFRHYSIANGMKMARLAPEMKTIQERYRKVPLMDPRRQQMQEEIGALYARHGMSMGTQMMVGCLPLLLTMPFLFAFYRVLTVSVDLRGAPFLWIPDLSQKDPLFLTPILMGLSMFVMQKLTPTSLDPAQRRIMMIMPIMLTGMFLWAPAGLNLYWLTSNLCAILQQGVEMRLLGGAAATAAARGGKRRA